MSISIEPLDRVAPAEVHAFLAAQAGIPQSVVHWKYYDPALECTRSRGFVLLRAGKIHAFYGLIPFTMVARDRAWESAWPCDWYVDDPGSGGAAGLILLKHVIKETGHMVHIGGSDVTRKIYARLASKTVEDGAVRFYLSLRLGDLLRRVRRRLSLPDWVQLGPVERLRIRKLRRPEDGQAIRIVEGVAEPVAGLAGDLSSSPGCSARYDSRYLEWLVGRCPSLQSFSCYVDADPLIPAGALFWSETDGNGTWRLALWGRKDATTEQANVLTAGIRELLARGGRSVESLVARLDRETSAILAESGFVERGRSPLHVFAAADNGTPVEELSRMTFLDGDNLNLF
jgi:hypothetical protein